MEVMKMENLTRIHQWMDAEAMAAKVMDIPLGNLTRIQWMIQQDHQLHISTIFHKADFIIQGILIPILSVFGIFGEPIINMFKTHKDLFFLF